MIVMLLAMAGAYVMTNVGDAWKYMFGLTAGVGLVMILRWFWWRVNAWSEISALAASALVSNGLLIANVFPASDPNATAKALLVTVAVTTAVWLSVTFATPPEPVETLERFYTRVRPSPAGWAPIARRLPVAQTDPLGTSAIDWVAGCGLVYGTLFGIGKLVLTDYAAALGYGAVAVVCAAVIARHLGAPEPQPSRAPEISA
jgi:hypothetical protein